MTQITYQTAQIAEAAQHIARAASNNHDYHQQSLQVVYNNANNLGGPTSDAFQQAIAQVNHHYGQAGETIRQAGIVLNQANDEMSHTAQQAAGQYT